MKLLKQLLIILLVLRIVILIIDDSTSVLHMVSRQLVYEHFVYDTSSTDISSTDIWYRPTITLLAEIEAGVMKQTLYQQKLD